ncbi:unnamed protein product [Rhizoctonia solani]|uniref:NAD-dependent epimerase/dehydratase domain-containing protein n=1 Tax=Rhizoctonia solani TaxID=456999 RepID=A0A8H3HU10_9AGAM|nr:unnamed protein product [Rhizoctonia solani]
MPFIQPPAKILLTGANGYYAVYVIKDLLERGYTVVGTVRSEAKGEELVKLFPSHAGKLTYAVVPNIVKRGAFDHVLQQGNFDAVAHAASPVVVPGGTVEDFARPAIDGTVGILESIKAHGSTVKRVVITSSIVTTYTFQKGVRHNETHWNEYVVKLVEEKGDNLPPMMLYTYSKTLAEKAAWKWWAENEKAVYWDLATVNPSYMAGAPLHSITSRDQLTSTNNVLSAIAIPHENLSERPWAITHVRDVAIIHSALFEKQGDVSGRRVIVAGSQPSWQDLYDALSGFSGVPKGNPGVGTTTDTGSPNWDTTFARELLGREFTVVGTVRSEAKGEELVKLFPSHAGKLSYAVVPNIVKKGAFDHVLQQGNFDAVAHAASPVVIPGGTLEDFVRPAIDGTVGILESIKAHGSTVKRVVITSSLVTAFTFQKGIKHNETHWNEYVIKLVEEKGDDSPSMMPYIYSKTVAEKAAWKWWAENEKTVDWDLATINPPYMVGTPIHSVTSRDQLTSTNGVLSAIATPHENLSERPWAITHVRDVAIIHSALFEKQGSVSGRRVFVAGSQPSWQDLYDALSGFSGVPKGNPGVGTTTDVGSPDWDTTFARELLGREFTGTKAMVVETEEYYRKKGWSFFV